MIRESSVLRINICAEKPAHRKSAKRFHHTEKLQQPELQQYYYNAYVGSKSTKQIHIDKNGREYIMEAYFVGGKMKFHRIYVIEGVRADEFYEKNATDLDFYINGDYELMQS